MLSHLAAFNYNGHWSTDPASMMFLILVNLGPARKNRMSRLVLPEQLFIYQGRGWGTPYRGHGWPLHDIGNTNTNIVC